MEAGPVEPSKLYEALYGPWDASLAVKWGCFPLFLSSSYRCFIIGLKPRPGSCYGIPFAWLNFAKLVYLIFVTLPCWRFGFCQVHFAKSLLTAHWLYHFGNSTLLGCQVHIVKLPIANLHITESPTKHCQNSTLAMLHMPTWQVSFMLPQWFSNF
jgi:hypothetical protein